MRRDCGNRQRRQQSNCGQPVTICWNSWVRTSTRGTEWLPSCPWLDMGCRGPKDSTLLLQSVVLFKISMVGIATTLFPATTIRTECLTFLKPLFASRDRSLTLLMPETTVLNMRVTPVPFFKPALGKPTMLHSPTCLPSNLFATSRPMPSSRLEMTTPIKSFSLIKLATKMKTPCDGVHESSPPPYNLTLQTVVVHQIDQVRNSECPGGPHSSQMDLDFVPPLCDLKPWHSL